MNEQGYLRHPAVRGDTIVFVCDDDLWSVDAQGGIARRLTAGLGEPATPCLSPDGQWLAFVSRDEQHPEVYLMPAQGGAARRMTWLGPDVMVRGFTPEGRILFVTTHGQPFFRNYRAYTLDVAGGLPQLLPLGQVNHLAYGPRQGDGDRPQHGRSRAMEALPRRHRGTLVDRCRRQRRLPPHVRDPRQRHEPDVDRRSRVLPHRRRRCRQSLLVRPTAATLQRHTDHDDFYARHAQTDGTRIVYQCGADI